MTQIIAEPLPLIGLCNCCLNEGMVKSMLSPIKCEGIEETYASMILKCYSLDIMSVDLGDTKRVICDSCVAQLHDAMIFRDLVECSLKTLEVAAQAQDVKKENSCEDLDDYYCDAAVDDAVITTMIKLESLNRETSRKRVKRKCDKSEKKQIKYTVREVHTKLIESFLSSGLFPFKIQKNNAFGCIMCAEKYTDLDLIKSHVLQHKKTHIVHAFKTMLSSGSARFHVNDSRFSCKLCSTELCDFDGLKRHLTMCPLDWRVKLPFKLEKDQLDCPICKKRFLNFVSLNTHMNVHYPNYVCENCGKAFASKSRLKGHVRIHEVGEFPCKHCGLVFDKVTKRENHISKDHKHGIRYACKRCGISLSSFYTRQKHLAEVHNEELKRYKCKACTQSYITPGHLSSHVRRDHLNERNHKCDKCDLAFYTRNSLKMHMIKHDGARIHSCPICQKAYQRKKTLIEHMRIHNNDKRFICPICGRAFTQKCTLKGHLKVHERKTDLDFGSPIITPLHSI